VKVGRPLDKRKSRFIVGEKFVFSGIIGEKIGVFPGVKNEEKSARKMDVEKCKQNRKILQLVIKRRKIADLHNALFAIILQTAK